MTAALYNRYRPRTFAEVVGQDHVTAALRQALTGGRPPHHAYLFSGPRGCGKTSSARILAASLNCEQGPTPTPCGVCEQCRSVRAGTSVDVVEIDAASHGSVEDTRDLRERAGFVPASARYRVFVVDEAHMITTAGFNALLKVVEEPPEHVLFVFATTDPDKVLPTIRSRTFQYHFRLVPPAVLRDHLAWVCEQEKVSIDPEVLPLVVRAGAGSVRDALSVLDQLISGGALDLATARQMLGATDAVLLDEVLESLAAQDGPALFAVVERLVGSGHDPRRFTADLLERLRDLVVLAAVPDARDRGLLSGYAGDQLEQMGRQASLLGPAELLRAADLVAAALVDMRGTTGPRLLLDLLCARLLLPASGAGAASWLTRLERLERRLDAAGPQTSQAAVPLPAATPAPAAAAPAPAAAPAAAAPAPAPSTAAAATPAPAPPTAPAPAAAPARTPGAVDAATMRSLWPQVLDALKSRRRTPHALLSQHGEVLEIDGGELVLGFVVPTMATSFRSWTPLLEEVLADVVGGTWRVSLVVVPGRDAAPGFAPGDAPEDPPEPDVDGAGAVPPAAASDPVALVRSAFGAVVISEDDDPAAPGLRT